VLARLERYELDVFAEEDQQITAEAQAAEATAPAPNDWDDWALTEAGLKRAAKRARQRRIASQATLFDATNQSLLDELRGVDVENLKPEAALEILAQIRKRIV
jgi:flagellar hook-basal body complex protein FliE